MKNRTYWALSVLVGLIIIGVCYMIGKPSSEHVETAESPVALEPLPEQSTAVVRLKPPPSGETFATGHWAGDTWQRTVPPAPETVMHEGKAMTLDELSRAARGADTWEEQVVILNRIIAEAPYSILAFYARESLATNDENGETIWDDAVRFERLLPLVEYHPDSPGLLYELLQSGMYVNPEAAIHYGTEALKYVWSYPVGVGHSAYPEYIHAGLAHVYQLVGDYSSAVSHYKQVIEVAKANLNRNRNRDMIDMARGNIDAILSGNPGKGPLARKHRSGRSGLAAPVAAPVASQVTPAPQAPSSLQPSGSLSDVLKDDFLDDSESGGVDPRVLAQQRYQQEQHRHQQEQQRHQQEQQRHQQAAQRFDTFVQELHQVATIKTEGDFEKFLTQQLVKRLQGNPKSNTQPDTGPSISADRMRRASQIFRRAQSPAAGLKELQKVDPDLAKTLQQVR